MVLVVPSIRRKCSETIGTGGEIGASNARGHDDLHAGLFQYDDRANARVVGYEANGGVLLGFDAQGPAGPLAPLMTRDCLLPMLAPLSMVVASSQTLADLVAALPARFTASDRLTGIPTEASKPFLEQVSQDTDARAAFFADMDDEQTVDLTDGLRVTFTSGDVVHLRPSGNAPEFRCYAEASSAARAQELLDRYLTQLKATF